MNSPELLAVCGASMIGSALAVWGVVRHELRAIRDEVRRAHGRIDALPYARAGGVK
ncbi:hypothetical protein [Variovorax sp. 3P27G3]|uniref:hypothetical protein n=1 Tax=Variovorax sp. 3P27G3 TaxID=2502214 RepID=UPI001485A02A|nr:hypothetical protein [Variovorax sp. 3P27G3]